MIILQKKADNFTRKRADTRVCPYKNEIFNVGANISVRPCEII